MKTILNHKWALLCAVLIGLIIAAPQIYFRLQHQDIYHDMSLGGSDESAYLSRIQEVRDGYYNTASYVWREGKDLPYLIPPLSEIITNLTGRVFSLNIVDTVTLGRFIFPAIVFLLIYVLLYQLIQKKLAALVIGSTVLLSTDLVGSVFFNFIFKQIPPSYNFLTFHRLVAPQVHLIFFFGFLVLWFFRKKYLSGIVLGLSFYTYPYTWTFLFAFLGCLAVIKLFKKEAIKDILITSLISLVIALPYFFNLWQALNHWGYAEVSLRYGLINTHMPQIGILVLMLLVVFLFLFPRRQKNYDFFLAWVLAPLVVLNQQIVTGRVLIPDHYHWYYHKPLIIIIFLIILFHYFNKKYLYWGLAGLVMAVNFYNAGLVQVASYRNAEPMAVEYNEKYGPVLEWLNENAQKDEVVAGDGVVADLIPMYTFLNSATSGDGHYSLIASEQQIMERIFLEIRLGGLDDPEEMFFEKRAFISSEIYGQRYRKQLGDYGNIPDEKLRWLIARYKDFYALPLEYVLNKYGVRYIIWDIDKDLDYLFLEQVYQDEKLKVYIVK